MTDLRMVRKPASLRAMLTALLLACGVGCTDGTTTDDTGTTGPFNGCSTEASVSVELGHLVGQEFTPFQVNEEVALESAPQGGVGVSVSVRAAGLVTGAPVDVLLEPYWNDQVQGSFVSEGVTLYCTEELSGDLWGVVNGSVVGFDPDLYETDEQLAVLDGEVVDLLVGVTDDEGTYAEAHIDVVISFD